MAEISQRGIDLIVSFEGKYTLQPDGRYKSYLDTLAKPPVWTLWAGLTKGITEDTCLTEEECQRLFAKELAIYEDAINRLVTVPLNQNQFDAITSTVYNIGVGAFENSTLLKVLNQGKYAEVPIQLMRWTHAGGVEYPGLVRRRQAEGALFMEPTPVTQALAIRPDQPEEIPEPSMPQRVEAKPAGTAIQAAKESWTLRGAALAFVTYAAQQGVSAYDWLFSVAKEAGPQVMDLKGAIGPFDALLAALKVSMPALFAILTLTGIVIVVMRRISAAHEGRIG